MNKLFGFIVPLLLIICMATLLNSCGVFNKQYAVSPPVNDYSDTCNNQVQAIVRSSNSGSTFQLDKELNNLIDISITDTIRRGDFDFTRWLKGSGERQLANLRRNGGIVKLMSQINNNAIKDTRTINQLNRDIANLTRCRQNQTQLITSQYKSKRISKLYAQNQLTELQKRVDRDNIYIGQLLGNSGTRITTYQDTLRKVSGGSTTAAPSYAPGTRYVSYTTLNVRDRPSTNGPVIGQLRRGEPISVQQSVGNWLAIDFQGRPAYIWAKSTTKDPVLSQGSSTFESGASSSEQQTAKSVQSAQNAQRNGEQKNQELAELKRQIDDDLAILDETLDET